LLVLAPVMKLCPATSWWFRCGCATSLSTKSARIGSQNLFHAHDPSSHSTAPVTGCSLGGCFYLRVRDAWTLSHISLSLSSAYVSACAPGAGSAAGPLKFRNKAALHSQEPAPLPPLLVGAG